MSELIPMTGKGKRSYGAIESRVTGPPEALGSVKRRGVGSDGLKTEEEVRLMPKFPKFLGNVQPPGGWHGPFGFLRMVAYGFCSVSMLGVLNLLVAIYEQESMMMIIFSALLIPAAVFAAMAAYSHEGLAIQVSRMARANDKYSSLNDGFDEQNRELKQVADKINETFQGAEENLNALEGKIEMLTKMKLMGEISTIMNAYVEARHDTLQQNPELRGPGKWDGVLTAFGAVTKFFTGTEATLKHNCPFIDMDDMRNRAYQVGFANQEVSLLIAAVNTQAGEEVMSAETKVMVALLFFYLEPKALNRQKEVIEELCWHLDGNDQFGNKAAVKGEINRLVEASGEDRVPDQEAYDLTRAVLRTFKAAPDEDDDDLCVSDDEDEIPSKSVARRRYLIAPEGA